MAKFLLSAFADEASDELEGQIAALKRNGLHCIEPRSISGPVNKKSDAELFEIRRRLDDNGITVPSLGSPIGKYKIEDDFAPHLAEFRRTLEVCRILGTRRMRMFSFFVEQADLKKYRDEVIRRLSIMVEEAEKMGIQLCHENEGRIYGQNPAEVADILTNVPGLRGIHDPANYVYNHQDVDAGFEATLPKLEYLHMKDSTDEADPTLVPVGDGAGHVKETLAKVDKAFPDRTIVLTVEPHLFAFQAFRNIDARAELKNNYNFKDSNESFDYAVNALKKVLASIGHEIINGEG